MDGSVYAITHDDDARVVPADAPVEVKTEVVSALAADPDPEKWYEKHASSSPMFHHDACHAGVAGASLDPKGLVLLWSKQLGGKVRSSAAIVDGKIYVVCDDGQVWCLDGRDGKDL